MAELRKEASSGRASYAAARFHNHGCPAESWTASRQKMVLITDNERLRSVSHMKRSRHTAAVRSRKKIEVLRQKPCRVKQSWFQVGCRQERPQTFSQFFLVSDG